MWICNCFWWTQISPPAACCTLQRFYNPLISSRMPFENCFEKKRLLKRPCFFHNLVLSLNQSTLLYKSSCELFARSRPYFVWKSPFVPYNSIIWSVWVRWNGQKHSFWREHVFVLYLTFQGFEWNVWMNICLISITFFFLPLICCDCFNFLKLLHLFSLHYSDFFLTV